MIKQLATGLAALDLARDALRSGVRAVANSERIWEWQIARYEREDRDRPPPRGGILFTGSSTIRFWTTLERDMAPLPVLNRGFGGAHLAHVNHYVERVVLPYEPAVIVLYAGDNDLGAWTGKTAATLVEDFERFVALVRAALPETRICFVSIKPSRLRRAQWPEQQAANERIEELIAPDPTLEYVDVATPMLEGSDVPARGLFAFDGLHLSPAGYELWASVLRPVLSTAVAETRPPHRPRG